MRLLQKATRTYIFFTSFLFLMAGVLLYLLLTNIIEEEASEQLLGNEKRIALQLQQGQQIVNLPPVLEVRKLNVLIAENITIKDTVAFDDMEGEEEAFRQVSSVRNINGISYRIILRQMIVEHIDYITTIGKSLVVVLMILLLFTTLMNRLIFRKLWDTFYHSLTALKSFSVLQDSPLTLSKSPILEFAELNTAIYKLTEKARSDFRVLKEFTENASHEIQTPLAIIQGKLDELLQDPNLNDRQASKIQEAFSATQKLSKLNQTLLLLTRIENKQFIHNELVNVSSIIDKQLSQLEDFIKEKGIQVHYQQLKSLNMSANPILVEVLVSNLLSNAIKHNIQEGNIDIILTNKSLVVTNTGKELPATPSLYFERFSKANPSSSSLGLGLSIVRSICNFYGWRVQYEIKLENHSLAIEF